MSTLVTCLLVFAGVWAFTAIASTVYVATEKAYMGSAAIGIILLGWGWPFFFFVFWPYLHLREAVKQAWKDSGDPNYYDRP